MLSCASITVNTLLHSRRSGTSINATLDEQVTAE
jgi:hypothetical protein